MAKFNVVQKNRREWKQDRKRQAHGDPKTGKLKQRTAPVSVSGKRQRKLLRRLSRVRLVTPPPHIFPPTRVLLAAQRHALW